MDRRKRQKIIDIALIVVGIGAILGIFAVAVLVAPENPFAGSDFLIDVGAAHSY